MISSEQRRLILQLGQVPGRPKPDKSVFLQRWGVLFGEEEGGPLGLRLLRQAVDAKSQVDVELALMVCSSFGYSEAHLALLLLLAETDWHHSHEDVAWMLGIIGNAKAVPDLVHLATWVPDYLEWDDARALGVKAVWSLYKIHSDSARKALEGLAVDPNELISKNAKERLQNW